MKDKKFFSEIFLRSFLFHRKSLPFFKKFFWMGEEKKNRKRNGFRLVTPTREKFIYLLTSYDGNFSKIEYEARCLLKNDNDSSGTGITKNWFVWSKFNLTSLTFLETKSKQATQFTICNNFCLWTVEPKRLKIEGTRRGNQEKLIHAQDFVDAGYEWLFVVPDSLLLGFLPMFCYVRKPKNQAELEHYFTETIKEIRAWSIPLSSQKPNSSSNLLFNVKFNKKQQQSSQIFLLKRDLPEILILIGIQSPPIQKEIKEPKELKEQIQSEKEEKEDDAVLKLFLGVLVIVTCFYFASQL
jgi:hypothetical protein